MATSDSYYDRHPQRVEVFGALLLNALVFLPPLMTGFPPLLVCMTIMSVAVWWYMNFKHRYFLARYIRSLGGQLIQVQWRSHTVEILGLGYPRLGDITYLDENQQVRQAKVRSHFDRGPELLEDEPATQS
jgi:hypothetical protein